MKNVADIWPLAPLQELMLAHALAGQSPELLVEQFHCRLCGPLDAAALRRACETVFERHPILRAAPAWEGMAKPVQVVRRTVDVPFAELDWRDVLGADRSRQLDELLVLERRHGFDLARPPLARFHLIAIAEQEWLFVMTCHHLIVDGWSLGIILRDIFTCYEQLREGLVPMAAVCGSFGDYLKWRAAQDSAAAERFWSEQLQDFTALRPKAPAPRSKTNEPTSAECEQRLSEADTARLVQLAQAERVGLNAVVQAAWALLLARESGRDDIVFGATVAGRPTQIPQVDSIVGPFINNTPCRVRVAADDRVTDVFARLRDQAAAAQPYEYCATDAIARAAGSAGGSLFDTLVVFENYPLQGIESHNTGSLQIRDVYGTATSSFRLTLVALPSRELTLRVLYDAAVCSPQAATALLDRVARLLCVFVEQPGLRVGELPLDDATSAGWGAAFADNSATSSPATDEAPIHPRPNTHPYVAPCDELESRISAVWSQVLRVEPVGMTDNFLDLGGTSSLAVSLMARLDEEFGRRLPLSALFAEPTAAHLARLLRAGPQGADASSLVPLRTRGAGTPLFCIHPAGGTVFCYLELAELLATDAPMYGLQAQGIDGTLAPHDTIEAMASHYIRAVKEVQPHGPYQLCGWSTGGIVAYEMARQLLDDNDDVSFVALIDAAIPRPEDGLDEDDLIPMLQLLFPQDNAAQLEALRERPLDEQLEYFRERAEQAQVLLSDSESRSARGVFDVFEANIRAVAAYSPCPLNCLVTLIRASEQATPMHADPLLGWGAHAVGGTETFTVTGHHLTMLQQPAVTELARVFEQCLQHAAAAEAGPTVAAS